MQQKHDVYIPNENFFNVLFLYKVRNNLFLIRHNIDQIKLVRVEILG